LLPGARTTPSDLVVRAAELGLDRDPRVSSKLTMLGLKLGKDRDMTTTKPVGEAGTERVAPADEAVIRGQLEHMMKDPRYWDNARREPLFVKKVEDWFKRLYGGKS
jgi:hypothetical protein